MAPTLRFLKPQDYVGVYYTVGDTARSPHDIPPKVAARWVEAGIAKWVTEDEIRKEREAIAAAEALEREAQKEQAAADRAKAAKDKASAAFAETVTAPAEKPKSKRKK